MLDFASRGCYQQTARTSEYGGTCPALFRWHPTACRSRDCHPAPLLHSRISTSLSQKQENTFSIFTLAETASLYPFPEMRSSLTRPFSLLGDISFWWSVTGPEGQDQKSVRLLIEEGQEAWLHTPGVCCSVSVLWPLHTALPQSGREHGGWLVWWSLLHTAIGPAHQPIPASTVPAACHQNKHQVGEKKKGLRGLRPNSTGPCSEFLHFIQFSLFFFYPES